LTSSYYYSGSFSIGFSSFLSVAATSSSVTFFFPFITFASWNLAKPLVTAFLLSFLFGYSLFSSFYLSVFAGTDFFSIVLGLTSSFFSSFFSSFLSSFLLPVPILFVAVVVDTFLAPAPASFLSTTEVIFPAFFLSSRLLAIGSSSLFSSPAFLPPLPILLVGYFVILVVALPVLASPVESFFLLSLS
jgi:hypothetical protein